MAFSYTSTHLHSGAAGKGAGGPGVFGSREHESNTYDGKYVIVKSCSSHDSYRFQEVKFIDWK